MQPIVHRPGGIQRAHHETREGEAVLVQLLLEAVPEEGPAGDPCELGTQRREEVQL